ncbi:MAG TPA: phosphoribosylformylglycinamidine synthase, partial [Gemmataceae bacterium]|nr:phosphoribosylformylglycinamidine synthase [Gemmataceae bacterium]
MLWEVEILPKLHDPERDRVAAEFDIFTHSQRGRELIARTSRGYLLEGELSREDVARLTDELLVDPLVESAKIGPLNAPGESALATVLPKPGVMDPVALSVVEAARDLGIRVDSVRTFRRYYAHSSPALRASEKDVLFRRVLANEAIEQVVEGLLTLDHLTLGNAYVFRLVTVPLRELDDAALAQLSRDGQLSLSLAEMKAVQDHFRGLGRDPTDVEVETLAQTWSEHCSHKTLKGQIDFDHRRIDNLLKETIFGATQEIRRRLGPDDWCVSVF